MGVRASWLADAARMTGYPVAEVNGWRGRGHGSFRVIEGVVDHHTADGAGEYPSLGVVTNGRAGLAGPLANYGLGRSGTVYVIADGVAYHAGASTWAGYRDLNDEFLGVEAESRGTVNDWSDAQRDCYPRLCAAVCHFIRRGADRVAGHKEVCLPRGRKIDPAYWDMNDLRAKVAWMLGDPQGRIPRDGGGGPDLDARQDAMLTGIYNQMSGSAEAGQWPGWPTWGGGTNEKLTFLDYARRDNVETHQSWLAVQDCQKRLSALEGKVDQILAALTKAG